MHFLSQRFHSYLRIFKEIFCDPHDPPLGPKADVGGPVSAEGALTPIFHRRLIAISDRLNLYKEGAFLSLFIMVLEPHPDLQIIFILPPNTKLFTFLFTLIPEFIPLPLCNCRHVLRHVYRTSLPFFRDLCWHSPAFTLTYNL